MGRGRGSPLTPEEKIFVILLKEYFDRNRGSFGSNNHSFQMVADALEIGSATVQRILANYNKDPENIKAVPKTRGRPEYSIEGSLQGSIRTYIRKANTEGVYITLDMLREQKRHQQKQKYVSTI